MARLALLRWTLLVVVVAGCDSLEPAVEEPLDISIDLDTVPDADTDAPSDTRDDDDETTAAEDTAPKPEDAADTRPASVCGNGVVEPGEGCDDGNHDDTDACPDGDLGACEPAHCGDGMVQLGVESCEPDVPLADGLRGVEGCNADCTLACEIYRGDCNGVVDDGCEASLGSSEHCRVCGNSCGDAPCAAAFECDYGYLCKGYGVYGESACDHASCGESAGLCEQTQGGCDCGEYRNYVEGEGCRLDASCGEAPMHHCVRGEISEPGLGRQCDAGEQCADVPGGICAFGMCTRECLSQSDCPAGTRCEPDPCETYSSVCLPDGCCSGRFESSQCAESEACDVHGAGAPWSESCFSQRYGIRASCLSTCTGDADCPPERPQCARIYRESDDFVEPLRVCVGPRYPAGLIDR